MLRINGAKRRNAVKPHETPCRLIFSIFRFLGYQNAYQGVPFDLLMPMLRIGGGLFL
jgi:hypothetical protein